ncbi:hypothetical protein [Gelidibacter gilvus]|uniref:Uncharacterized protein n=1 Tax=Gelidibacter gilvus TaxID=59602 RepID=A0A4Q0XGV4_9FLAO|nr:hypothetical protein [Gelidibacter gilvus]RXJ50430.1 hypothetical protein ESZ48_06580 [Gelidibacter gilvus]
MININSESEFESHIRNEVLPLSINENYKLFDFKKAVDLLIARNGQNPKLFFLEVKYHQKHHGHLGVGQGKGGGFQPEVLRDKSDYFETNMRWILGSEGSDDYWFVDNATIRKYLNAGVIGPKYNGIRKTFFTEVSSIAKSELIIQIQTWIER